MKQTVKIHKYEYSEEASNSTRIVTICSCCGNSRITPIRLSQRVPQQSNIPDEVDQMDLWVKPPRYYMPKVMSITPRASGFLRPTRFD